MKTIEESIEVEVPVSTAYNQWTQFESFPQFMDGVEWVEQKDDTHLHWVAKIGGNKREWDAEVTEQHPDHRIAWRAIDQPGPNGVVTFHKLDEGHTKVMVQMEYGPEGVTESMGSFVGTPVPTSRSLGLLPVSKTLVASGLSSEVPSSGTWTGPGATSCWARPRVRSRSQTIVVPSAPAV